MTNASLLSRTKDSGSAAVHRLRDVLWAIMQASAAAGIAWYIAHDVLGHPDPFFAPITAAVCVSASDLLHAQHTMQNIGGVALGIVLGAAAQLLLGTESLAIAVAVLLSLCVAVLIGHGFAAQGMTFASQAATSAILVTALSGGDGLFQRLQEALIGGGLALVFTVLLFPDNPLTVLREARVGMLGALHNLLAETAETVGGGTTTTPNRPSSSVDRVHERLGELIEARANARRLARTAPRWWAARNAVRGADQQAAQVSRLADSSLHLVRALTEALGGSGSLPQPVHDAIGEFGAGLILAETDPDAATAHATAARRCTSAPDSAASYTPALVLANVVQICVDDLQQVIDLRQR